MRKIKDTDYLFISARVKAMESNLLTRDRMERMVDAPTVEDAAKILTECGYPELPKVTQEALDHALTAERLRVAGDFGRGLPNPEILDVFTIQYDYHNVKSIIKAEAMDVSPDRLLMDIGRIPLERLREAMNTGEAYGLPDRLRAAIAESREVLGNTGDPQLADFVLDRACYDELSAVAQRSNSPFLAGYVRLSIDSANLRSVVRALRMRKGVDFLKNVLFDGGDISVHRLLAAVSSGGTLESLYASSPLYEAMLEGVGVLGGGPLTKFEKLCDNALNHYLAGAKYVAFGEQPVVGYLAAKENEYTAIRIIMTGRMAGLDGGVIRERLRDAYV